MPFNYLPASMAPDGLDFMRTVVAGTPNLSTADIPDKVRPLRKFAQSIGVTRPYKLRKAPLIQVVKEKLRNE